MEKILVVDDIKSNRALLKKALILIAGYEVIEAESGQQAISKFEAEEPDLILMDVNMPGMDGYQSASKIKSLTGDNYIPIIFVTALSEKDSLIDSLASGGDDFISKPFDMSVLQSKINAHLRIRNLNQQLNEKNTALTEFNKHLSHEHELIEHFFVNVLQQSFLDEKIIKYHMSSLSAFNGDLLLVERGPRGGVYVVMGDFTGHGLTAAMGTLPVAAIFFKMAKHGTSIGEISRELNYQLNTLLPSGMFFSATLLEINSRSNVMTVWMGGMPESYWFGEDDKFKGEIHSQHMPLGILSDAEFEDAHSIFSIENGDKLYLCSDGITEAERADGKMFGDVRLKKILTENGDARFEQVLNELKMFTGDASQTDDITFVEVTCADTSSEYTPTLSAKNKSFALPWKLSFPLSVKDMQEKDPVTELSNMLASMPALKVHQGVFHVLLSEMYSNALDHSILGLDGQKKNDEDQFTHYYQERTAKLYMLENASITIDLHFFSELGQAYLKIKFTDTGKGYTGHTPATSSEKLHGRGLEIINSFCENVSFSNEGRTLEVIYRV